MKRFTFLKSFTAARSRIRFGFGLSTLAAAGSLFGLTACIFDGDKESEPRSHGPYVVLSTTENSGGYLGLISSLDPRNLNLAGLPGNIKIDAGWGSGARRYGNHIYVNNGYGDAPGLQQFTIRDSGLITKGEKLTGVQNFALASADLGFYWNPERGTLKIQTFNPQTMERTGEIDLSSLSRGDSVEMVGERILIVRDGKLFADVVYAEKLSDGSDQSLYDTAYVAVIDIASRQLESVTKRAGVRYGVGYPAEMEWAFPDSAGNLYFATPFLDPWVQPGNRGGTVLRIKAGETAFDPDWIIEGKQYGEHRAIMGGHVKGGWYYFSMPSEPIAADWKNFSTDVWEIVRVNLETRQLEKVPGVPLHRFNAQVPVFEVDGKLYFNVLSKSYNGLYVYDPADGSAAKPAIRFKSGGAPLRLFKLDTP